jgi:hypothetical protein
VSDEREAKLPRWAQRELDTLRMRLAESDARYERAVATLAGPNTAASIQPNYEAPRLPVARFDENIYFATDSDSGPYDQLTVRFDRQGELQIMGGRSLLVMPKVTNVVAVKLGATR